MEFLRAVSPRVVSQVLFDFDGTLSLLRRGWAGVMVSVFMDALPARPGESDAERRAAAVSDVTETSGAPTIQQMTKLAERVREREGTPLEPATYKRQYLTLLERITATRKDDIRRRSARPDDSLVPGSRALLELLRSRGLRLHLASGTDEPSVVEEAALLEIAPFFAGRVNGARDGDPRSTKQAVIGRLLREANVDGASLLSFGDGYVEIQETKDVGGLAVGVASDEAQPGRLDEAKRRLLIRAGADVVIPDYRDAAALLERLIR
jgi:phosphoglycolate phosphatase